MDEVDFTVPEEVTLAVFGDSVTVMGAKADRMAALAAWARAEGFTLVAGANDPIERFAR